LNGGPAVVLDGDSLTVEELARAARDPSVPIALDPAAVERLEAGRRQVEAIADRYRRAFARYRAGDGGPPVTDYGVTTGFGKFKDQPVAADELERLQRNLLLSHAVGVGESSDADEAANYFPAEVVRATLLIRLNAFLKGHSGVRPAVALAVKAMLERGIVPLVPQRGSLGSSGDLCPLAHLFAVFLGTGRYYRVQSAAEVRGRPGALRPAAVLAEDLGMEPPQPSFKEGLALINGATFSAALLALAVHDAARLAGLADVAAGLTLEAICGCARAFDPLVHRARGMRGQRDSAANVRLLVAGSELVDAAPAVQDVYSVRCAPAVHGASRDAIAYARMVVERELNAATDNPLFFPSDAPPWDHGFRANWPPGYHGEERRSYSAGNFHGQPIALAADFLAIAVAELADVAERRVQMLLDPHHNRGLPADLTPQRGVNSGYMICQYTAASLVSENKVLCHPASVDSIPTSANSEDHVAMATTAARKLRSVLANAQAVVAIELMVAAQAVEWRLAMALPPQPPAPPAGWAEAEEEARRFRAAVAAGRRPAIAARLGRGSAEAYRRVRAIVAPLTEDRSLAEEIRRLRRTIEDGSLLAAVEAALGQPLRPLRPLRDPV